MMDEVDVAIVGGGIAGLATLNRIRELRPDLRAILLESSGVPGGKIQTECVETAVGRFVVEAGPDAMLAMKPWAADLVRRLGHKDQLVPINQPKPAVSICINGVLQPMGPGFGQIGPTSLRGALRNRLLSPGGKVRAIGDLVVPRGAAGSDESVAAFASRRFGRETLERIAEPLAAGIYNADPARLSMQATLASFRAIEQEHRSLLLGMRDRKASGAPSFQTMRDGMHSIVQMLVEANRDLIRTETAVISIRSNRNGFAIGLSDGSRIASQRVVVAVPPVQASHLLTDVAPAAGPSLSRLRTADSAVVTFGLQTDAIRRDVPGYGIVFPAAERLAINAITISSRKFPFRAPEGFDLVRVFVGGYRSPDSVAQGDERLLDLAQDAVRRWLGVSSLPLFTRLTRWTASSPQYDVGHLDRIAEIEQALPSGIALVGGAYRGIGIPDVVRDAERTAALILEDMSVLDEQQKRQEVA